MCFKIIILIYMFMFSSNILFSACEDVLESTELILAFMVHRHGDRTSIPAALKLMPDPAKVFNITPKHGLRLTDVGKRRSYKLGQFIRHRYDNRLASQFDQSEIFIRSTDSVRTEVTALIAMSAVYPTGSRHEDINWEPIPYSTENRLHDYNLGSMNCPTLVEQFKKTLHEPLPSISSKYGTLLNNLTEILGFNVTEKPAWLFYIYESFMNQISLGVPLDEKSAAIYPELTIAAPEVLHTLFHGQYVALHSGVLLNKFFEAADKLIAGVDIPRVHVYSAHDLNVFHLQTASRITPRQMLPKYCALYSLELRRVFATGQYIVVPVYLPQPGEDETYLKVEGCEGFCDFDRFRELTAGFVLDEKEWRTRCAFREDYDFSFSLIE